MPSGCWGKGCRSRPFLRMDARLLYEHAPRGSARRQAASRRSGLSLLPSRMLPQQDRNPCWGCGREARIVSTTWAGAGPRVAAQWITRWGVHAA